MYWIDTKDKLPRAQERVVFLREGAVDPTFGCKEVNDPDNLMWADMLAHDRDGYWLDVYDVTHWLPLPELPSLKGEQLCSHSVNS